ALSLSALPRSGPRKRLIATARSARSQRTRYSSSSAGRGRTPVAAAYRSSTGRSGPAAAAIIHRSRSSGATSVVSQPMTTSKTDTCKRYTKGSRCPRSCFHNNAELRLSLTGGYHPKGTETTQLQVIQGRHLPFDTIRHYLRIERRRQVQLRGRATLPEVHRPGSLDQRRHRRTYLVILRSLSH